jgi:hypothetical protein
MMELLCVGLPKFNLAAAKDTLLGNFIKKNGGKKKRNVLFEILE